MTLGELINLLEKYPEDQVVKQGFGNPHSWRGVYAELAFEPAGETTVGDMLDAARSAVGATYEGWKGGEFTMDRDTTFHIEHEGSWSDGSCEKSILFEYMLGAAPGK